MITYRPEKPKDGPAIDYVLDVSFGPGRFAKTAYRLREGVEAVPELSYVVEEDGEPRGTIRYWPVLIGGAPSIMLGPVAVLPEHRGRGMAIKLMELSLSKAVDIGHRNVILVGDEPYYARVGFSRVPKGLMTMPGPVDYDRLLWRELVPGGLEGLGGPITRARS